MSELKLCKDCAHFCEGDHPGSQYSLASCRFTMKTDLVSGETYGGGYCQNERAPKGDCGPDARHFLLAGIDVTPKKPSLWQRIFGGGK